MVVPALLLIAGLLIGAGRLANAQVAVQQWADSSARTASLARDAATAQSQARAVIASDAAASGVRCRPGWTLELDTSAFARPVGTPGVVRASVVCPIPLADLLVPGFPGSVSVRAESSSTLDRYRGRR
ncbi:pilus assembly protein TadE [Propioniciclava coleopterorum]|uniref:Pilus assembly protein TadE n=1 Tax=Propioniciclava coleopterorum TaxID=2714937 RepID=A0A6G7Y647_9ACTN|nr:pilus assembly protein TadE [Propioniciclava coleopterorum]QIK72292.1 pilus assembly protein TadE [Propioniciclava coleopterorum]